MDIGQRIKQRRKDLNMSVDELADQLGKNRATIYRYEKGEIHNLPIDILESLAIALETTPQYLMGWADHPYVNEKQSAITRHIKEWQTEFEPGIFTEEEHQKLLEYARFLISLRKTK